MRKRHGRGLEVSFTVLACVAAALTVRSTRAHAQGQLAAAASLRYVEVDARVSDADGNPVRDLRKEDFHLLEDGVEQTVAAFANVDLPIDPRPTLAPAGTVAVPDVVTNTDHAPGRSRFYVLLLDDLQIAPSRTATTTRIVTEFVERHLGVNDQAAIVATSGRTDMSLSFTSNAPLLVSAAKRFEGIKPESIVLQRANAPATLEARANETRIQYEHFQQAQASLDSLESLCAWLGGISGMSKSVVLISEGLDYDDETDPAEDPWAGIIRAERRESIAAATRANVTVYAIDPRGSDNPFGGATVQSGPKLQQEMDRAHARLREIASATGGLAFLKTNDFEAAFNRIVRQASTYYLLGYHPRNDRAEGKPRTIVVSVMRPGLQVAAKGGYTEPDPRTTPSDAPFLSALDETTPTLRGALNSPLPRTDMTLAAHVAAFRGEEDRSWAVVATVESPSVTVTPKDGKFAGAVELIVAAIDERNQIASGQAARLAFTVTPENARRTDGNAGFRTMARLKDLIPGRYELRIATADAESKKQGSVWYAFELPDFWNEKLSMSGLMLASRNEGSRVLAGWMEFADAMPVPATTVRAFRVDDELSVFAEVYDNDLTTEHQITVVTSLVGLNENVQFTSVDHPSSQQLASTKGVYRLKKTIPLTGAAPGRYVVRVQVGRGSEQPPVVRAIPITILQ
jgi:VWFA-related protein